MTTCIRRRLTVPKNDNHSLRIPTNARPWASDFLLPKQTFEVTLTVKGIYDYFCAPHEEAGMVGRLIVGSAVGPGALPFDYYLTQGHNWKPVPPAAQQVVPDDRSYFDTEDRSLTLQLRKDADEMSRWIYGFAEFDVRIECNS